MGGHGDNLVGHIILVQFHTLDAFAAAVLYVICIGRHTLDITVGREADHDILDRNQIFIFHIGRCINDFGTAGIAVLVLDGKQFFPDNIQNTAVIGQNILVICDLDQNRFCCRAGCKLFDESANEIGVLCPDVEIFLSFQVIQKPPAFAKIISSPDLSGRNIFSIFNRDVKILLTLHSSSLDNTLSSDDTFFSFIASSLIFFRPAGVNPRSRQIVSACEFRFMISFKAGRN